MDKKLNLTISLGLKSMELGRDSIYRILSCEGIDAGAYSIALEKYSALDGARVADIHIDVRRIDLAFEVVVAPSEEESTRRWLTSFFNPRAEGTLTVDRGLGARSIDVCVAEVRFVQKNLYMPIRVEVGFVCPNPYFYENVIIKRTDINKVPLFTFPLNITPGGVTAGLDKDENSFIIRNGGDVPIGVELYMTAARGRVVSPCVSFRNGSVNVLETLDIDDAIYISTVPGRKMVEINGKATYNFDRRSVFFSIPRGTHTINVTAEQGLDNLQSILIYSPRYLGA